MNVKNVEKENGSAKVTVEIAKDEFQTALDKAYAKIRKDIMIPGFRKGKAPRKFVERMYGSQVFYEDAVSEIFPDIYEAAIVKQELKAVGQPSVTDMQTPEDGSVVLTVSTELYPEVTLGEYKGIEVPKESVSISKAEVDAELSRMQERNARIETVDREAKTGDTVVLDFEGFVDGKPFDGGKAATFQCKIHEVKETIKPELDDEFAKDVSEYDTLAALKKSIKADLAAKRQEAVDREFENEAVVLAGKNMTCNIPACMIDEQVDKHLEQFAYQLQSQGMKMDDYLKMIGGDVKGMRDSMRPMAEQTVRSNILLSEIVHQENLDVTEEEVEEELKKMAEQYKMELDKIREMVDVEAVKSDLKGRKAVKLIVDNAKPVEKEKKTAKKAAKKEDAADAPAEEAKTEE